MDYIECRWLKMTPEGEPTMQSFMQSPAVFNVVFTCPCL